MIKFNVKNDQWSVTMHFVLGGSFAHCELKMRAASQTKITFIPTVLRDAQGNIQWVKLENGFDISLSISLAKLDRLYEIIYNLFEPLEKDRELFSSLMCNKVEAEVVKKSFSREHGFWQKYSVARGGNVEVLPLTARL